MENLADISESKFRQMIKEINKQMKYWIYWSFCSTWGSEISAKYSILGVC